MAREFIEEMGMPDAEVDWKKVVKIYNLEGRATIHFFTGTTKHLPQRRTTDTGEPISLFPIAYLPYNLVPDLKWIIPLSVARASGMVAEIRGVVSEKKMGGFCDDIKEIHGGMRI